MKLIDKKTFVYEPKHERYKIDEVFELLGEAGYVKKCYMYMYSKINGKGMIHYFKNIITRKYVMINQS